MSTKECFTGCIDILDREVYVNTNDGTGLEHVIKAMEPSIRYFLRFSKDKEDLRQDIYIFILEGVKKYNPNKGKLTTFLFYYVKNQLINRHRKEEIKQIASHYQQSYEVNYDKYIDLQKQILLWDSKWKHPILRVLLSDEKIANVSKDINVSDWKLRCEIKKYIKHLRKKL